MTLRKWTLAIALLATAGGGVAMAQTRDEGFDVVRGAPYSGEGTTTVNATLMDGTRVNRQTTAKLYRDSAGRIT